MMSTGSTGLNIMFYGSPMMSPEHNSMPTMNTAEMFDNMWCSSDSGVSGDQSPAQPTSPSQDDDQCLWDPGDTSILEANLFNDNRNIAFEDDLDLFSFANELGTEDEIEQLSFPDNISETSSSSSTITSHSIPSSPEHFSDHMNPSTDNESLIYPGTLKCGNTSTFTALCDTSKRQRGNYKKSKKSILDRQRKQTSEESSDNANLCDSSAGLPSCSSSPEDLEGSLNENSDTLLVTKCPSPSKKNFSCILDSNVKWSELGISDQRCLADGFDTIISQSLGVREHGFDSVISQSLGVREQLDVKAILKPHNNRSSSQDVHVNNLSLLDDDKLEAVRRYLKSLEAGHSNTRPYHRPTNNMQKKSRKKSKVNNISEQDHPGNLFKSEEKSKNKEFEKSKSNYNRNKKLKENLSENKLKGERNKNYKSVYNSPKFKKETLTENNPQQAIDYNSSNIDLNMTISQPSISWQQRKRLMKPQRTNAEEYQKEKRSPIVGPNKSKETQPGKPQKDSKKKTDTKIKTPTKKSRNCKQELRSDFLLLRTRSRKEYRQLMKEKRSGLFLQEQVVSLSTVVADPEEGVHLNLSDHDTNDEDDNDVDILG